MSNIKQIQQQWSKYDPDMNTEPMALTGRLFLCTHRFNDEMKKVYEKYDLNRPNFDLLATLLRVGKPHALTPNELVEQMLVTSGTVTNRIDKLVAKGLVKRTPGKKDKRSVLVKLSKKGKQLIESMLDDYIAIQVKLTKNLSKKEQEQLNKLLSKLH